MALLFGVIALLLALAASTPYPVEPPQQSVPKLSAKSFKGTELVTSHGYNGSALIAFTVNTTTDKSCKPCNAFEKLTKSNALTVQHATWWKEDVLRIAKVYCNQHSAVCDSFGVSGDSGTEPGYPYLIWFKGGKEFEPYDGERTLDGIIEWVKKHQASGAL